MGPHSSGSVVSLSRDVTNPSVLMRQLLAAASVTDVARSLDTVHYTALPGTKEELTRACSWRLSREGVHIGGCLGTRLLGGRFEADLVNLLRVRKTHAASIELGRNSVGKTARECARLTAIAATG
jgi:hypothetical protein